MPSRVSAVIEAEHRARQQFDALIIDLRAARLAAGLSQARVARAIGRSRPRLSAWEQRRARPGILDLARWAAVVGLEVSVRAYPGGSPVRDVAQLRVLARLRSIIGPAWRWRAEVPVSADPRDRRAFDALISNASGAVAIEIITRLTDAQAQVRAALLKLEAARLDRMILVLSDTRHNRAALAAAAPGLRLSFPLESRDVLRELRKGRRPLANGVLLV